MKEKNFLLENLYIKKNNVPVYEENGIFYGAITGIIEDISLQDVDTFKEYLEEFDLDILLKGKNNKNKTYITEEDLLAILEIIDKKNNINDSEKSLLINRSRFLSKVLSDLLGLNVYDNPSTDLNIINRKDIIVSAKKMLIFRSTIEKHIYTKLLSGNEFRLYNMNNVISLELVCALNKADIKINNLLNNYFDVRINKEKFSEITGCIINEKQKVYKIS